MPDREPEPWQTDAPAPFITTETAQGNVEVWAVGEDRFWITAPGHEQIVVGFEEAERTADTLAEQLGLRARAEGWLSPVWGALPTAAASQTRSVQECCALLEVGHAKFTV